MQPIALTFVFLPHIRYDGRMRKFLFLLCIIMLSATAQAEMLQMLYENAPESAENYFDDTRAEGEDEDEFVVEDEEAEDTTDTPRDENYNALSENNLTIKQKAFYRSSFNWMMEWGKEEEIKAFKDKKSGLTITYHAGSRVLTSEHRLCRPYSLKMVMEDKQRNSSGIACQIAPENWCSLRDRKHAKCRLNNLNEWDNIANSMNIKKRNLSINTGRFFRDLGF